MKILQAHFFFPYDTDFPDLPPHALFVFLFILLIFKRNISFFLSFFFNSKCVGTLTGASVSQNQLPDVIYF